MKLRYVFGMVLVAAFGALLWLKLPLPRWEEGERVEDDRLHVVTTFAPLFIFTANVAGDAARVENLLPNGVGPHEYSFTPQDALKIADADIVVKQGRGIDDWVDEVIRAARRADLTVVVASAGIEPHTGAPGLDLDDRAVEKASELPLVRPTPDDPHLWLDPFLAIQEVEHIRNALMERDSAHREKYARNAEEYILKLLALDREIRANFRDFGERDFVSFHPAFRYFAYEYGLREVGVVEEIPGEEPTPQELARLIEDVRRAGVKVVFSEPQFLPKIVELLRRDYGLVIAELDPLETGELRADYYEEVIRKNVATLIHAFR